MAYKPETYKGYLIKFRKEGIGNRQRIEARWSRYNLWTIGSASLAGVGRTKEQAYIQAKKTIARHIEGLERRKRTR